MRPALRHLSFFKRLLGKARLLVALSSLGFVAGSAAGGELQPATPRDLAEVSARLRAGGDIAVNYTQESLTMRGRVRISRGSALLGVRSDEGRFLWRRDEPTPELWFFDGRSLAHKDATTASVTVWPAEAPFARDMRQIASLVTGIEQLARDADVRRLALVLGGGVPHTYLEIVPRRPGEFARLSLLIDDELDYVRMLELHFVTGQATRFTFSQPKRMSLPDEAFRPSSGG